MDDEFPIESIINQLQSLQEQFNSVSSDSTEKNSVTDSLISRKEKGEITREELNKLLIKHLRDKHDKMVQEQTDSDRKNSSFAEKVGDSVSRGISRIFKKVFSKSKIDLEDTSKDTSTTPPPGTYDTGNNPDASQNEKTSSFKRAREVEPITKFINVSIVDIDDEVIRKLIHIFAGSQHNRNNRVDSRSSNSGNSNDSGGFLSKLFDIGKLGLMAYIGSQLVKRIFEDPEHSGLYKLVSTVVLTPVELAIKGAYKTLKWTAASLALKFASVFQDLKPQFLIISAQVTKLIKFLKLDTLFMKVTSAFTGLVTSVKRAATGLVTSVTNAFSRFATKFPKIANIAGKILRPIGSTIGGIGKILGPIGKIIGKALGIALRRLPLIGSLLSFGLAIMRFKRGENWRGAIDVLSGLLSLTGFGIPIAIALDVLNIFLDHKVASDKEAGVKTSTPTDWIKDFWQKTKDWLGEKMLKNGFFIGLNNFSESVSKFVSGDIGEGLLGIFKGLSYFTENPLFFQGFSTLLAVATPSTHSRGGATPKTAEESIDINKAFKAYISSKLDKVPSIKYLKDVSSAFKKIKNGDVKGGFEDFIKASSAFGIGLDNPITGFGMLKSLFFTNDSGVPAPSDSMFSKMSSDSITGRGRSNESKVDTSKHFPEELDMITLRNMGYTIPEANRVNSVSDSNTWNTSEANDGSSVKPVLDNINDISKDQSESLKKQVFLQEDNNNLLKQLINIIPNISNLASPIQMTHQPQQRGNGTDSTSRDIFKSSPYGYATS